MTPPTSNPLFNLESYRVPSSVDEVFYIPNFITEEEEEYLLRKIAESSQVNWRTLPQRRLQVWGGEISSNTLIPRPLPSFVTDHPPLIARLRSTGAFSASKHGEPNHIIVNEYHPGQGIMPHEDGPAYHPAVATISMGSHAVFHYHRYRPENSEDRVTTTHEDELVRGKLIDTAPILSILLEPRSLVLTAKNLYRSCLHAIEPVEQDIIAPASVANRSPGSDPGNDDVPGRETAYRMANFELLADENLCHIATNGGSLYRKTRVSLTCRDVERVLPGKPLSFWSKANV